MITINYGNTLETHYPKKKECKENKILYRVTFGYKSKLSGDTIFPVTYDNFDETFQTESLKLNAGDIVKYTPQNKNDPNYNNTAIITLSTNRYEKREAQRRGLDITPNRDKYSLYDIKFIVPVVGSNNTIIKERKEISRLNKDKSVQLTKIKTEVESYVCEDSFLPDPTIRDYIQAIKFHKNNNTPQSRRRKDFFSGRLWNDNFKLDKKNEPMYPLMDNMLPDVKRKLEKAVENMVTVGFLLGKKKKSKITVKSKSEKFLSFLMPIGSKPGDEIKVMVKNIPIKIRIPMSLGEIGGDDREVPKENEYIKKVPISQALNSDVYDNLKSGSSKSVKTGFKPTYIKASEYIGKETQKDLDMLVKPGESQEYFINNAKIVPQNGNKFTFKKLTTFDKSLPLIFDLYVLLDLTIDVNIKSAKDVANQTFGDKITRTVTAGLMNAPNNCPEYMKKAKKGMDALGKLILPQKSLTRYTSDAAGSIALARTLEQEDRAKEFRERQATLRKRRRRDAERASNIASGREGVRVGGRKKKKTKKKKKKCIRRATKRLNKCWRKKKRKTFKKCWKKGRKKYKTCKKKRRRRR